MESGNSVIGKYTRGINPIKNQKGQYFIFSKDGDVVQLTDANGNVIKNYHYDAFGVEENIDKEDSNPFRYCAEYHDNETGSIYLRARYYNPSNGRFMSEDISKDGLNWYTYCINNPVLYKDPTGYYYIMKDYEYEYIGGGEFYYGKAKRTYTVYREDPLMPAARFIMAQFVPVEGGFWQIIWCQVTSMEN